MIPLSTYFSLLASVVHLERRFLYALQEGVDFSLTRVLPITEDLRRKELQEGRIIKGLAVGVVQSMPENIGKKPGESGKKHIKRRRYSV